MSEREAIIQTILDGWPLMPVAYKQYLPEVPAIYIVLSNSQVPLYVGRTTKLRSRWGSHHQLKTLLEFDPDARIAWAMYHEGAPLPRDKWLEHWEKYNIQMLRPPFNKEWKHIRE